MNTRERPLHEYLAEFSERTEVRRGVPLPWGTHAVEGGINFAFFSRHATQVRLELFGSSTDATPTRVVELDPAHHRTGDVWHVWVGGIGRGQCYAYRVDGPYDPHQGHRFNSKKLLLDPYATAITQLPRWDFDPARGDDPSAAAAAPRPSASMMPPPCRNACSPTSISCGRTTDRRAPGRRRSFTKRSSRFHHPSKLGVQCPGTYRGLTEKIPYLKELGVTAVELMPVQEFNDTQVMGIDPQTGKPLRKLLGIRSRGLSLRRRAPTAVPAVQGSRSWSSRRWFGPSRRGNRSDPRRGVQSHGRGRSNAGRRYVSAGSTTRSSTCWRQDKRHYMDYTGTGNTINANHPVVREHILNALRYWVHRNARGRISVRPGLGSRSRRRRATC